jgi:hypothetical protein
MEAVQTIDQTDAIDWTANRAAALAKRLGELAKQADEVWAVLQHEINAGSDGDSLPKRELERKINGAVIKMADAVLQIEDARDLAALGSVSFDPACPSCKGYGYHVDCTPDGQFRNQAECLRCNGTGRKTTVSR